MILDTLFKLRCARKIAGLRRPRDRDSIGRLSKAFPFTNDLHLRARHVCLDFPIEYVK